MYHDNRFLGNNGLLRIMLLQSYEVLLIRVLTRFIASAKAVTFEVVAVEMIFHLNQNAHPQIKPLYI